jgi:hypothetical protein
LNRLRQEWAIGYRAAYSEPNEQDGVLDEYLDLLMNRALIAPDEASKIAESNALKAEAEVLPFQITLPTLSDDDARDGVPIYVGVLPLLPDESPRRLRGCQ